LAGTVVVKYILVNALSLYSLLLGRTFLSKLGHVVSFMCLKVKFPTLDDKSETMKVDQKIARKQSPYLPRYLFYPHITYKDRRPHPLSI